MYMGLAFKIDFYHLTRAAAYVLVVIWLGFVVARGIQRQQRWLIVASLLPTILVLLMAHPFLVLFHPLIFRNSDMSQLHGPGTLFFLLLCGSPVAMCALPYTVVLAIWAIMLTRRERRKVSTTIKHRGGSATIGKSTEDDRE